MRNLLVIALLALSTSLTGCMSYSRNQLAPVEAWPPLSASQPSAPAAKQSVYVRLNSIYQFNGEQRGGGPNMARFEKTVVESFQQSERFSRVTSEKQESDVYAYTTLKNNEQGNLFAAVLTGATFYVIPSTFDNTLTLETTFKDRDGKLIGKVTKSETVTTWMQLLFVFAVPFNSNGEEVIRHLSQSTVEEAIKRKLI